MNPFLFFLTPTLAVTSLVTHAPEILRRRLIFERNQSRFTAGKNRSSQGVSVELLKESRLPAKKSQ